jgi:hypothetical protein
MKDTPTHITHPGDLSSATIGAIARFISLDWKNVYFGAKPYLNAMYSLHTVNDSYGQDSAKSIITYFLCNATTYRGPNARLIKAHLLTLIKGK